MHRLALFLCALTVAFFAAHAAAAPSLPRWLASDLGQAISLLCALTLAMVALLSWPDRTK